MIDTILMYPNGGSGGGGGGSMDVNIPSGTLFDSVGWANEQIGSGWQSSYENLGGVGNLPQGKGVFYEKYSGFNKDNGEVNYKTSIESYLNRGDSSDDWMKDIEFGLELEGEIKLVWGLRLLVAANGDISLAWKLVSLNHKEISADIPTPWMVTGTISFQFEGKLAVGVSFGPAYVRYSLDLTKAVNELENWHRQATSRIYNFYDFGGSGFNTSQLP